MKRRSLALTAAAAVFAAGSAHGGSKTTELIRVGAATSQYAMIKLKNSASNWPSCASSGETLSFDKTTDHGKAMFSVALAAITARQRLVVVYSDTDCGLWGTRPLVTRLDIVID